MPERQDQGQPERQPIERQGETGKDVGNPGRTGDTGRGPSTPERGPEKTGQREARE